MIVIIGLMTAMVLLYTFCVLLQRISQVDYTGIERQMLMDYLSMYLGGLISLGQLEDHLEDYSFLYLDESTLIVYHTINVCIENYCNHKMLTEEFHNILKNCLVCLQGKSCHNPNCSIHTSVRCIDN